MRKFFFVISLVISAFFVISCDQDIKPEDFDAKGIYVLNNGSWGYNNSCISIYDPATKTLKADAFFVANGQALGDLGQDILISGDYIYISVNGSQLVFVTDRDLNVVTTIVASDDGVTLSPRYLAEGGGKIYVTYYEGYLGEITPETWNVRTTSVGPNPDGLAYCHGNVYVANSGGYLYPIYNNTVSVVNAASFKETSTITVNTDPSIVKACGTNVYVASYGNSIDIPAKVQCIDTNTGLVTDLDYSSPSAIALHDNDLYVLCAGYDSEWNPLPGTVYKHNAKNNSKMGVFIDEGIQNAYSISVTDNYLWVGASDYVNNGDVYVYSLPQGSLYDKFDSAGLNPICVAE